MLQQEDRYEFIKPMILEIEEQDKRGHWILMKRSDMLPGYKTIMSAWSFKRNQYPEGQQVYGMNCWYTYSQVVNWISVTLLLIIWLGMWSIDFGIKDQGIIFMVDIMIALEFFVDADFAQNWKNVDQDNPKCVHS